MGTLRHEVMGAVSLLVLCFCHAALGVEPQMPRLLGEFDLPHAGFIETWDREDGGKDMYFTTFNPGLPFFHDPVYFLRDPGNYLDDVSSWPDHLGTLGAKSSAYWPNFPIKVPKEVLGFEGVVQTSGFLVPGKTAGKIELFDTSAAEQGVNHPIDIAHGAREGHDWSYHWVVWKDIDNDGLIDALTARFRVPTFGDPISQLIFLKNLEVDTGVGQCFEAHWADLNNDGVLEIMASCYDTRKGNETGNLFVYEQDMENPDNPTGFKRRAIAAGFVANSYLFGSSMTPGKSRLFWPSEEYKSTPTEFGPQPKPWIALSGDDDGIHYIMFPLSEDPTNWDYDLQIMVDTEETTSGTMAIDDLDGDGYTEIVSAGYTAGKVYVYTFAS